MKKISTAHILLLFVLIAQFVVSFALAFSGVRLPIVANMLIAQGSIVFPFAIYCIDKKQNPLKLIRMKKISFKTAIFSVLIAWCSYPVAIFLNFISMLFVENAMTEVMSEVMPLGLVSSIILIAFIPAVVEETVFRGMLYNTYSKRRPLMGIILSAILFGLMHGNLNQLPYTLFLGLVMAFLMEAADSILAPMILHFTLNGTSTLMAWLTKDSAQGSGSANIIDVLKESYRASYAEQGIQITEAQLEAMIPIAIVSTLAVYAVIAAIAGTIAFLLIYSIFRSRGVTLKDVFKADRSDTAYVEKKNGQLRKNRMIDGYLILFILVSIGLIVLSTV